jgi:hypothetical protein
LTVFAFLVYRRGHSRIRPDALYHTVLRSNVIARPDHANNDGVQPFPIKSENNTGFLITTDLASASRGGAVGFLLLSLY